MSRRKFLLCFVGTAVLLAVGLPLGYKVVRPKQTASSSPSPEPKSVDQNGPDRTREPERPLSTTEKGPRKRALLIGVTKYDNLPQFELVGPGNDVQLMRKLLETSYQFPAAGIVTLSEGDGRPERRPTRANIEREFRRLGAEAREGDQVVILMAGHGDQQPEPVPPDPEFPEPDGIDEIFLPADVKGGTGSPMRVPNAVVDNDMRVWLRAITDKKAHVWIIFDCCHSGTMTRGTEVSRQLPPGALMPPAELKKARLRAAGRGKTRGTAPTKATPFVAREPSDYLVALYACRSHETTPESPQPPGAPDARSYGLLTYSLVNVLTQSASSKAPLTYRELAQRIQMRYATRTQPSPTPMVEGKGQVQEVLGNAQPVRPHLLLSRSRDGFKVNAGDLFGLTTGSVLAVYSPAGTDKEPKRLGHVRVTASQPFQATVEPCAYQESPLVADLPDLSNCEPVFINYELQRFKVAVVVPDGQTEARNKLLKALEPLTEKKKGIIELVKKPGQAEWLVQIVKDKVRLVEPSNNRPAFELPELDDPGLEGALRSSLGRIFRARNLMATSSRFAAERYRGISAIDVQVEVLKHKTKTARGEVWPRPDGGWVFKPGDLISFRIHNKSKAQRLDVNLLIISSDFQIQSFYPSKHEVVKTLRPGESVDTPPPPTLIGDEPPFGPECMVVIAVPATNPPADFGALAQDGLVQARSIDKGNSLRSPLGEFLASAVFGTGTRGVKRAVGEQHAMRLLNWRTVPK